MAPYLIVLMWLSGSVFNTSNVTGENLRRAQSNNRKTNENINSAFQSNQQSCQPQMLAMPSAFTPPPNIHSRHTSSYLAPSLTSHPASFGSLPLDCPNQFTAQPQTMTCAFPGAPTNNWQTSTPQPISQSFPSQCSAITSFQYPSAPSTAHHASKTITPLHQSFPAPHTRFVPTRNAHPARLSEEQSEENNTNVQNVVISRSFCGGPCHSRLQGIGTDDPRFVSLINRLDYSHGALRTKLCQYTVNSQDLDGKGRC